MRRREGNKEQAILKAAIRVFAEKGYHESKVSKIAEIAGVANGSVYLYYNSKEELLLRMIESLWSEMTLRIEEVAGRTDQDVMVKIEKMVGAVLDVFTSNPKLSLVVIKEHNQLRSKGIDAALGYYDRILKAFCRMVDEGKIADQFSASVNGPLMLHFIFGGFYHTIHLWVNRPQEIPVAAMRENALAIVRKSLAKSS
jgi:TetR/AcrR family fatty acid metabolism transcriptional regulator